MVHKASRMPKIPILEDIANSSRAQKHPIRNYKEKDLEIAPDA